MVSHLCKISLGTPNSSLPKIRVKLLGKVKEERWVEGEAVSRAIQGLGRSSKLHSVYDGTLSKVPIEAFWTLGFEGLGVEGLQ